MAIADLEPAQLCVFVCTIWAIHENGCLRIRPRCAECGCFLIRTIRRHHGPNGKAFHVW